MVTTLNFKDIVDLPKWRPLSPNTIATSNNFGLTSDLRNNEDRHPFIYFNNTTATFQAYNVKSDEWILLASPALATNFTDGVFMPAQGPRGTIAAGATTTSIPLTTALPTTVGVNQLANRGDGRGFKVRIIGNAAGSSGKTEERLVIANTGQTTTPTLLLDSALSFIPAAGDAYEFLSGKVYLLGNTNAAGSFKFYDVLTNSFSGNLATANLPASWTDSNLIGLDELYVPYDRNPGEGFFNILTATASAAASLTGQAAGGDAGVVANQYRNFQIRIIQDTAIPTAVGQRRNITSHTGPGASPVYTVPAWAVIPSATAIYVIENNGDRIIGTFQGTVNINTYTISTNAWDVAGTIFSNRPVAPAAGLASQQSFGIEPDTASPPNARQSFIFSFRGGISSTLDLFDIAGAATGLWTGAITYGNSNTTITIGGNIQDPATMQGRYMYILPSVATAPQRVVRFDMKNRVLEPYTTLKVPNNVTPAIAPKMLAYTVFIDGNTKLAFIIDMQTGSSIANLSFGLPITR